MGIVFDIKRFAVHDGPGIRTTVFLKGCPLGCWWCHNPESIQPNPQQVVKKVKLDGRVFEEHEQVGKETTIQEIISLLNRERIVMEESGGGVTFSGGEPFLQAEFLLSLLMESKKQGFHTAVDTSGFVQKKHIIRAMEFTDLFLFDLKMMEYRMHQKYTGVSNRKILKNLKLLSEGNKTIRIRIPVVTGINDSEKNISKTIAFLKPLKGIEQVDLLPFHRIGKSKYDRFGLEYKMLGVEENSEERIQSIKLKFEKEGFKTKIGG